MRTSACRCSGTRYARSLADARGKPTQGRHRCKRRIVAIGLGNPARIEPTEPNHLMVSSCDDVQAASTKDAMEDSFRRAALDYHRLPKPGKISVTPTKNLITDRKS